MNLDFSGRTAIVTGAGHGIGRGHAMEMDRNDPLLKIFVVNLIFVMKFVLWGSRNRWKTYWLSLTCFYYHPSMKALGWLL